VSLNIPWTARKQSNSIEVPAQNLSLAPGQRVEALADLEGIDNAFLHHWASLRGRKVKFIGHLSGAAEDGHITVQDVEFIQEQVKSSSPPPFASTSGNTQTRQVEKAV
jgi:hypothetical protein